MRGWLIFGLLACAFAACSRAESPGDPPVTIRPARSDGASTARLVLAPLPVEVALPAYSQVSGGRPLARALAPEIDEVVVLDGDRVVFPGDLRVRPLAELAPRLEGVLAEAGGSVTAAAVVPSRNTIYVLNPDLAVPMASVIKLVIMLALLDAAESEGRTVTAEEVALLDPMVTWSDNDSASLLWRELGYGPGIEAYLQRIGIPGVLPDAWTWGDSRGTGASMALLLSRLAFGDLVSAPHRALALNLLSHVSEDQRWGVGGALVGGDGAVAGTKDGWYPAAAGWRAGSAGVLLPGGESEAVAYSIAILTAENESLEGAIETIQGIAALVQEALNPAHPPSFPVYPYYSAPVYPDYPEAADTFEATPFPSEAPSLPSAPEAVPSAQPADPFLPSNPAGGLVPADSPSVTVPPTPLEAAPPTAPPVAPPTPPAPLPNAGG